MSFQEVLKKDVMDKYEKASGTFSDVPEEEQEFLKLSTENFLKIWTAKEACVKCSGVGVSGMKTAVDKSRIQSFYFDDYIVSIYE